MYRDLDLPLSISTTERNPYKDLIIPILKVSKLYKRGVAFFSSNWIELAGEGLLEFVENKGNFKLLTSIELGEKEYDAFKRGEEAKNNEILKNELIKKVENGLNENNQWTFNYLSWLIANEILEVRFTVHTKNKKSIYHDKVAIFSNEDKKVCLNGSFNDSLNALFNQETINVFISWDERDNLRIIELENYFDKAWNNEIKEYEVFRLPEMIISEFRKRQNDYNPYKSRMNYENTNKKMQISGRGYQNEAVGLLEQHNWRGILNMATGTGKTITSLLAVDRILLTHTEHVVCIVVPQLHLLYQWEQIINDKCIDIEILKCAENKKLWGSKLYRHSKVLRKSQLYILTTYKTLIDDTFQDGISRYEDRVVYIFDECHKLGSTEIMNKLVLNKNSKRIGLSATPNRWLDEEGNSFIENKIGPVLYEFTLSDAIRKNYLTPYEYFPHFSQLSDSEFLEFMELTNKIGKASVLHKNEDCDSGKVLESLLNKRASISKGAKNKFSSFISVFDNQIEKKFTLVYVYDLQVNEMVELLKSRYKLNVHGIVASTKITDRTQILNSFDSGEIDVIVAIQCLDEGVDLPNCKYAYILASSTNPREFIQRRGRILRKAKDKKRGIIHDFITIAPDSDFYDYREKGIVIKRELQRIAEFTRLSINKNDDNVISYLTSIKLLSEYSEKNPWNIKNIEKEVEDNE